MSNPRINWFINWEDASRDTIDFKKVYVDLAGDLVAGLLLSQIIYWHLPKSRDRSQSRLQVERDGHLWLAKAHAEWWDECRLSVKQVKRAMKILAQEELVVVAYYQFAGMRTTHIRIDWDNFLPKLEELLERPTGRDQRGRPESTKGTDRKDPNGPTGEAQRARLYTENTTENTTEILTENTTPPTGGAGVDTSLFDFLTAHCGVWEQVALDIASDSKMSLETVIAWWVLISGDQNIKSPAAVLVHHLNNNSPAPYLDNRQHAKVTELVMEYGEPELEEEE